MVEGFSADREEQSSASTSQQASYPGGHHASGPWQRPRSRRAASARSGVRRVGCARGRRRARADDAGDAGGSSSPLGVAEGSDGRSERSGGSFVPRSSSHARAPTPDAHDRPLSERANHAHSVPTLTGEKVLAWVLRPGKNEVMAKGINSFGREGHVSRVLLRYFPAARERL